MRKTIIGILVATSLLVSGAAANAEIVAHTPTTFTNFSDSISHEFSAADAGQTFQEFFDLTIPTSSSLFAGVISGSLGITGLDITGLTLQDNTGATIVNGQRLLLGPSAWALTASVAPGTYSLDVAGLVTGPTGGSFGGFIAVSPVPEASTSAMLLGGLALVGFAAARRRQQKNAVPPTGMLTA